MTPLLLKEGHEVVGLDSDLYSRCTFGSGIAKVPDDQEGHPRSRKIRSERASKRSYIWPALSNDPLGNLDPDL